MWLTSPHHARPSAVWLVAQWGCQGHWESGEWAEREAGRGTGDGTSIRAGRHRAPAAVIPGPDSCPVNICYALAGPICKSPRYYERSDFIPAYLGHHRSPRNYPS